MKKTYAVLNFLTALLVNIWNMYTANFGLFGKKVGELSNVHDTLFTPANYAFSIWGVIFLALFGFSCFHLWRVFLSPKDDSFVGDIGPWFIISNILNCFWVWVWLSQWPLVSVFVILALLFSLVKIIRSIRIKINDAPVEVLAFVWWPLLLYTGWINVASIANISAYFTILEWNGGSSGPELWAIGALSLLTVINLFLLLRGHFRIFAFSGIWGLIGIAVKNWTSAPQVGYFALSLRFTHLYTSSDSGD